MKTAELCSHWREAIRLHLGGAASGDEAARIETHLAACADCRRYAEQLRGAAAGLRWLADRPAEPSLGFRARWTQAVEDAARPRGFGETAAALLAWWRGLLLRNLRPALGVASLWILTLVFRLSTPEVAPPDRMTARRSPIEIYRALQTSQQLFAGQFGGESSDRATPRRHLPAQPRSEGLPAAPTARMSRQPAISPV